MVVASVLMAMGMMMLPPVIISLPFKIIFFVLVDGWYMVVGSLAKVSAGYSMGIEKRMVDITLINETIIGGGKLPPAGRLNSVVSLVD